MYFAISRSAIIIHIARSTTKLSSHMLMSAFWVICCTAILMVERIIMEMAQSESVRNRSLSADRRMM